jgi:hypothetical protein
LESSQCHDDGKRDLTVQSKDNKAPCVISEKQSVKRTKKRGFDFAAIKLIQYFERGRHQLNRKGAFIGKQHSQLPEKLTTDASNERGGR